MIFGIPAPAVPTAKSSLLPLFLLIAGIAAAGCGGGTSTVSKNEEVKADRMVRLTSIEGHRDTVTFHIGSPLFLRMDNRTGRGCAPRNGQPFIFGANGGQLSWGFAEAVDSLLFPHDPIDCHRYLYLSSEESNLIAEGYYPMSVALFLDEKESIVSDTIVLHPIHSDRANQTSYSRFLLEQLYTSSALIGNRSLQMELFADHLPQSYASKVYQAVLLYRSDDPLGAIDVLRTVTEKWPRENANAAAKTADLLDRILNHVGSVGE